MPMSGVCFELHVVEVGSGVWYLAALGNLKISVATVLSLNTSDFIKLFQLSGLIVIIFLYGTLDIIALIEPNFEYVFIIFFD